MRLARSRLALTSPRLKVPVLATLAVLGAAAAAPGTVTSALLPLSPAGSGHSQSGAATSTIGTYAAFFPAATSPIDTPPPAAMVDACRPSSTVLSCDQATEAAINAARSMEGLGPLSLPKDYADLSYVAQIVAVTNAERTARGLPALTGPRQAIDLLAQSGAAKGADPSGPVGTTWVSNMADGIWTPLQADYEWMYNDGPGGSNADCTPTDESGCWAHRDNILSPWDGSIGAGVQAVGNVHRLVFTELLVKKP